MPENQNNPSVVGTPLPNSPAQVQGPQQPAAAQPSDLDQPVYETFAARGGNWTLASAKQKRGKGSGTIHITLVPDPKTNDLKQFINQVISLVGEQNFYKTVRKEIINPFSKDAERDAEKAAVKRGDKDGDFSPQEFIEAFAGQFLPDARRAEDGVKQIREKMAAIMKEIEPLMAQHLRKETRDKMSQDEINRLVTLMAEFQELSEKEEGKRKKSAASEKAAQTPPPVRVAA